TKDLTKLTSAQWRSRIGADYDALWDMRGELLKRKLGNEGYFIDIAKANLEYAPTLWDFVVTRWTGYLTEEAGGESAPFSAGKLLAENYKADFSPSLPPAEKAAAILEITASMPAQGRETAAGMMRIQRLLLPLNEPGLYTGTDSGKAAAAVVEVLKKWKDNLPSTLARAQAAYEAGKISANNSWNKQGVEFCAAAMELAPRSRPASDCEKIKARIELPELQLSAKPVPPPGKGLVSVTARNIPAVYFRLYRTSPGELQSLYRRDRGGFDSLRTLNQDEAAGFLDRKADVTWKTEIDYPAPYQFKTKEILPPPLKKGLYVLAACGDPAFSAGASLIKAAIVNVTDIFLLGTAGIRGDPEDFLFTAAEAARPRSERPELFHFYAVNALSGLPLGDAPIEVFHGRGYSVLDKVLLRSDADGRAVLAEPVQVAYGNYQHFQADPLLSSGGAYALWSNAQSSGFSVPAPIEIRLESDRPVYRPGQKVSFKATVLSRVPRGFRVYSGAVKLKVTARDANWQEFYSKEFPVSPMGSVSGSFEIPAGRMLGSYQLTGALREYGVNFSGEQRFQVEEYKRPEFEVSMKEASDAFRYGQKARVEGSVKYYFGSPVPDAEVKYRITRARYVPWYAWWWSWFYAPSGSAEFASGAARTDGEGKFFVEFTPKPEEGSYARYPASFNVEVEARDAGGRTITDARSYYAGSKAYNFDITPDAGFFTSDKKAGFQARLMNLNGAQMSGGGTYSLARLEKIPDLPRGASWWGGQFGGNPSLEQAFGAVPDGAEVDSGSLDFSAAKPTSVKLKALPAGVYRLRLSAKDPWGGESGSDIIIVSADPDGKNPAVKLPPVALFEHASYQPGETARVLVGAGQLKGVKYAEVLASNFILAKQLLRGGGVSVLSLKVEDAHRGGFAVRWFGAGDFNIYSAMGKASVPRKDRELDISLPHPAALEPGQKVNWTLKASDKAGRPVEGEGTVRVFDRSLEYYVSGADSWLARLYPERLSNSSGIGSVYNAYFTDLPVKDGLVSRMFSLFDKELDEEKLPSLRINSSRGGRRRFFARGLAQSMAFESEGFADSAEMKSEGANLAAAAPSAMMAGAKSSAKSARFDEEAPSRKAKAPSQAPVAVRKDFSETAYFNPQLKISRGQGPFTFRIPERLTSWKVDAAVLTRDVKKGAVSSEVVTRKELMARLDIPRFFREGDRSELTAVLSSQAQNELSGEVTIEITLDGKDAADAFSLTGPVKNFTLKPGGSVPLRWPVTAPRGTAAYKVRVIARAAQLSDAQENDLPVLPSRERLIASRVVALDGKGTTELRLDELEKEDKTRQAESMHLEVQPQLILTVLNSLPFLVHYPHECTEQLLNRYVPLAITNSFYKKYPELAASVKNIPKRETLTPAWERDNPVRMMTLMETPWENESKGRTTSLPVIDMLDPKLVKAEKDDAITKLAGYQNADGSFPWFPGGHSDLYMTLYVLDGLAEAARYGVEIPRETAKKALGYVLGEIPAHMKPDEHNVAFILYAAYVVTSFPPDWAEHKTALGYARKWAQYADKQARAMTPFGKAYASYVWLRLGDKKLSESY
ncbi:MAG TPA: hypothetical protein DCZ92_07710, partial [Elusimicrobia bacterium]|nr:hypothetical protein [Elusimicrobiota bacterium]